MSSISRKIQEYDWCMRKREAVEVLSKLENLEICFHHLTILFFHMIESWHLSSKRKGKSVFEIYWTEMLSFLKSILNLTWSLCRKTLCHSVSIMHEISTGRPTQFQCTRILFPCSVFLSFFSTIHFYSSWLLLLRIRFYSCPSETLSSSHAYLPCLILFSKAE